MPIPKTSPGSDDFVTLKNTINKIVEKEIHVRLTSLVGKTENDVSFNAHTYVDSVPDNRPFSELFIIPAGQSNGDAVKDPTVQTWLKQHTGQRVVCEEYVYINNSLAWVAVVGNPEGALGTL